MGEILGDLQYRFKASSVTILSFVLRAITGFVLGLTLALVLDVILGYGALSFLFVIVMISALVVRLTRGWSLFQVLILDLVCVLLGLVLRMYVLIAPGA